jgi:hypothetical protein
MIESIFIPKIHNNKYHYLISSNKYLQNKDFKNLGYYNNDMILSALGQARTVLVLGLYPKGLIPFKESIFDINISYNPYPGNMGRHNHPLLGPSVLAGYPYGLLHAPSFQAGLWL